MSMSKSCEPEFLHGLHKLLHIIRYSTFVKMENMIRLMGKTEHTVKIDQRLESLQFKNHGFIYNVVIGSPVYALIVLGRAFSRIILQLFCLVD